MAHTYEELKKRTIAELRDIAKDLKHEAVQGYTQLNKEHLLPALCQALGIDAREHHVAHGEVKVTAKTRMKELRAKRQQALEAGDNGALKAIRREYHRLNHRLRADARRPAPAS
jgi:DNA-binding IclR family transcriptional regulator